jgi:hypothetical protein
MSTKLEKPLRRELEIDGERYTLVVAPDGLRLTKKRFRSGLAMSWRALIRQLAASDSGRTESPAA